MASWLAGGLLVFATIGTFVTAIVGWITAWRSARHSNVKMTLKLLGVTVEVDARQVKDPDALLRQIESIVGAHELARLKAEQQQELEAAQRRYDMKLKQERMEMYANALQGGDVKLLALRLAGHGDDVNDVISMIMEQRKLDFARATQMLDRLLEANLLNRKDVAGIMAKASGMVIGELSGPTPQVPATTGKEEALPQVVAGFSVDDEDDEDVR